MSKDYEGMSEAEAMSELARLLWERYMKPRATKELLNHSLDGYKAQVYSNNEDGTLTVIRPFDDTSMTLKCPPALAESAEAGDQVLVIQLGDASNSFILCGTDMSGFGEGGSGQFRPISFDFSDIGDGYFTEVVEDKDGNQVTTVYDVTFDANGRIDSVTSRADDWETEVQWGTYQRTPASEVSYDATGTSLQSNTVQGAISEIANGGGGGGGGGASETIIATVEASSTASKNYAVDDYLILSGVLYKVISPISSGGTITVGTNVTSAVLGDDVAAHVRDTNNPHGVTAAQAGAMPSTATLDDIPNGTTYAKPTAAEVAQIGTNQTNISTIEGKIPSAASPLNQLADKDFVTDSITQGTAIFRGSFATKAALLAVQWQTTNPSGANYVSNNDYAVVLDDESQNDECWRYVYVTGTGWSAQYRINESPLTQAQLDALNSGATAAIISSVGDKLDKTGDGKDVTATFTTASTRANISTGEKLSVMFGKIAKWFSDLGTAAFRAATGSITSGSTDLVESGAVYTGLARKQDTLTFDNTPTSGSNNPVKSGGVYEAVQSRVPNIGKGVNIFDNPWFTVNQRGVSSGTAVNAEYFLSRWVIRRASYSISGHTVTVTATANEYGIYQPMKLGTLIGGEKYTISADIGGEIKSLTFTMPSATGYVGYLSASVRIYIQISASSVNVWFTIPTANSSFTVSKAKLELGEESTLEGDVEPDYEQELVKCQTSTADSSDTYANKTLATEQQIAYVESGTTASRAYAVGEYFCWNGLLYRVKLAINSGEPFTVGTNCESVYLSSNIIHMKPFTGTTGTYGEIGQALEAGHNLVGVRIKKAGTLYTNVAVTLYDYAGEMRGFYLTQVVQGTRISNAAVEADLYYI